MTAFSGVTVTQGVNADGTAGGPFDVDPGILNLANAVTATANGVTTVSANSAVVMIAMVNNDRTYSGWTSTSPGALNELVDYNTTDIDNASIGAAWAIKSVPGPTGNGIVDLSASDRSASIMFVLKSATPSVSVTASAASVCTGSSVNLNSTLIDYPQSANIAFQGFESAGSTVTYAVSGGNVQNGSTGGTSLPANSPYAFSGVNGYRNLNANTTLTLSNVTGLLNYTNKKVSLKLASFSVGAVDQGADVTDNVTVEISLDGGATYSSELRLTGFSNANWGYLSGTGIATASYDGNNTPTQFAAWLDTQRSALESLIRTANISIG